MMDSGNSGEPNSDGDVNQDGNGAENSDAAKPQHRLKSADGKSGVSSWAVRGAAGESRWTGSTSSDSRAAELSSAGASST